MIQVPHKHAAVIKAWADGAQVQFYGDGNEWEDIRSPGWSINREYRIKPKPKVKKYRYVAFSNQHAELRITVGHYPEIPVGQWVGDEKWVAVQKIDSTMIEVDDD